MIPYAVAWWPQAGTVAPDMSASRARRRHLVAALVLPLSTVAACGASGPGASPSSGPGSAPPRPSVPAPAASAGCATALPQPAPGAVTVDIPAATVKVTDPGSEPRRLLAQRPARTQVTKLFTNSLQVSQVTGDQPSGGNRDVTLPITAQPSCSDPGDVALFFGAPTSTDPALTQSLSPEAGTVGHLRATSDGQARSITLAPPAGVAAEAQSTFEQALLQTLSRTVALPADPVGAGARWTVTRRLTGETDLTQTMTVTAKTVGVSGTVELTAHVDESPDDSVFRVPGSNTQLAITSYTSEGPADVDLDAGLPLPTAGGVTLQGGRTLTGDEQGRTLVQKTGFTYRFGG